MSNPTTQHIEENASIERRTCACGKRFLWNARWTVEDMGDGTTCNAPCRSINMGRFGF